MNEITDKMVEAACKAVVLGDDENSKPVHLSPKEARAAISAALAAAEQEQEPFLYVQPRVLQSTLQFPIQHYDMASLIYSPERECTVPLYTRPSPSGEAVEARRLALELEKVAEWINGLPIPTDGATRVLTSIRRALTQKDKTP